MDSLVARQDPGRAAPGVLLTDLYELTMLQAYFARRMNGTAVFELFVRRLPEQRNFLVAAGLDAVMDYLLGLRFTPDELDWLRASGRFTTEFVDSLAGLRFTGDVDAMPEGTLFFADEPILRIVAPIREAQLVESRVMNLAHFATLTASKAARVVLAAPGRLLVDFGMRRAHGAEAALLSARSSYLAGFTGTATVEAGRRYGIPLFGTMAHSYVQAHEDEAEAFERFALAQPENATLLIDTYDTEDGAAKVAALAPLLAAAGVRIRGVRIDSGDLAEHARRVRAILDEGGLPEATIFASGNLDEWRIAALARAGAPIDGFGVGTRMNTSSDAPYLDCAYKLQEYEGEPRRKRSEGKATWPGRKQVYRHVGRDGRFARDLLALADGRRSGRPLLVPYVRGGEPIEPRISLEESREHARREIAQLPERLRSLDPAPPYRVEIDPELETLAAEIDARSRGDGLGDRKALSPPVNADQRR
ncbi:MAG TPA: nicotinate phosphoribosyltransferase [Usitatibacter sp.]|nr:nicotinate phosphoribosyltransferase [Usitatibacter sp.]